jgi:hypothetical protein
VTGLRTQTVELLGNLESALGHSQQFGRLPTTSALPQQTDVVTVRRDGSKVPQGERETAMERLLITNLCIGLRALKEDGRVLRVEFWGHLA